jgi:hypothetical protein
MRCGVCWDWIRTGWVPRWQVAVVVAASWCRGVRSKEEVERGFGAVQLI